MSSILSIARIALASSLVAACSDSPSEAMDSGSSSSETDDDPMRASTGSVADGTSSGGDEDPFDMLVACDETDLAVSPFAGPGFDPETGELLAPLQPPYIVATTIGWPKPEPQYFEDLGMHSEAVVGEIFANEGLIGASFGGSQACGNARTLSIWTDEEALMDFVLSGAHLAAMPIVATSMLAWETTHWTEMEAIEAPTWELATDKLIEAHGS